MLKLSSHAQFEAVQKDLFTTIGDEEKTDLAIICAGNVKLLAHKIVLATASSFMKSLLKDQPLIEATTTVHFPDVSAIHFRLLLEFVYTGQVKLGSADHCKGLKELLELLQCDVVQSEVVEPAVELVPKPREPTPAPIAPVEQQNQVRNKRRRRRNKKKSAVGQTEEVKTVAVARSEQRPYNQYQVNRRHFENARNFSTFCPMNIWNLGQFRCTLCIGSMMTLTDLVYHLVLFHPSDILFARPGQPLRFSCMYCMLVFNSRQSFENHLVGQHMRMIRMNNFF